MPTPRINMRKVKDALRLKPLWEQSRQQIATALGTTKRQRRQMLHLGRYGRAGPAYHRCHERDRVEEPIAQLRCGRQCKHA